MRNLIFCGLCWAALTGSADPVKLFDDGNFLVNFRGPLIREAGQGATAERNLLYDGKLAPQVAATIRGGDRDSGEYLAVSYRPTPAMPFHRRTLLAARLPEQTVLMVADFYRTATESAAPRWVFNTSDKPENVGTALMIRSDADRRGGRLNLEMLRPAENGRTLEFFGNPDRNDGGYRNVYTITKPGENMTLAVLQAGALETPVQSVDFRSNAVFFTVRLGNQLFVQTHSARPVATAIEVDIREKSQVWLSGLAAGRWKSPELGVEFVIDRDRPVRVLEAAIPFSVLPQQ